MILTFAYGDARTLFETGVCKKLSADMLRRAIRKLEAIEPIAIAG